MWSRTRPAGSTTWTPITFISSTSTTYQPALAVRPSGAAYVIWTDLNSALWGERYDPASGWQGQSQITSSGSHYTPVVALDTANAVVVAADYNGSTYDLGAYIVSVP